MILRAIKIRLYPNKTQEQTLNKVLGSYRFVYNQMLALKQNNYKADKTNLKVTDLSKWFHRTLLKDEQYAWLKEQNTKVMKQAIRQMDGAYQKDSQNKYIWKMLVATTKPNIDMVKRLR